MPRYPSIIVHRLVAHAARSKTTLAALPSRSSINEMKTLDAKQKRLNGANLGGNHA
jgi:hypothetical protein